MTTPAQLLELIASRSLQREAEFHRLFDDCVGHVEVSLDLWQQMLSNVPSLLGQELKLVILYHHRTTQLPVYASPSSRLPQHSALLLKNDPQVSCGWLPHFFVCQP